MQAHQLAKPRTKTTRYPANVSEYARRLYANGRSVAQIREALLKRGYVPTRSAIWCWVDPEVRDAHNTRRRLAMYPNGRLRRQAEGWQIKRDRMRQLRKAGLSFSSVAAVMNLDFDLELSSETTRMILNGRITDRTVRKHLSQAVES